MMMCIITAAFLMSISLFAQAGDVSETHWRLQYSRPADEWVEALPIGNGRMGAMIFGRIEHERIQFNEDTLWTGRPMDYQRPGASEVLPELRRLLFEGRQKEAERLAAKRFMSDPLRQCAFQPFGDVLIDFEEQEAPVNYKRSLDLDTALAEVAYQAGGTTHHREIFASYPDQVMVMRLWADAPGALSCTVHFDSQHPGVEQVAAAPDRLALKGQVSQRSENNVESELRFEAQMAVRITGGRGTVADAGIQISNADAMVLIWTAATSYVNYRDISGNPGERCASVLDAAAVYEYDALKQRHVQDYQSLFHRVSLDLGGSDALDLDTSERLKRFRNGDDPHLAALQFQYGRYLLMASSRPGSQPANLQGVWNESPAPSWDSKYTVNINTEMNYWPAEPTNLSECHEPLFDLIRDCSITGAETARNFYKCNGWVLHHNTDLWRGTAPINASDHGIWVSGGAWLCRHVWQHYEFTQDENFLKERAYPVMKEAARFFVDYLVEDPRSPNKWLISGPSNSPELGGLVMGPAMDHQIIRALFASCIQASEILDTDQEFREILKDRRARIAPNQVGQHGQLQEWLEDKDDPKEQHRHISHLWGLHPGNEITRQGTPEWFDAARQSLLFRGDGGTGWSMAWKINFWARLQDGEHAWRMVRNFLTPPMTLPNLFGNHPPFQIDGNFGFTSGVTEMLLQSHADCIELLPALPSAWPKGRVTGLRARGGFEVDIAWDKGQLTRAILRSPGGGRCRIRYRDRIKELTLKAGESTVIE